MMRAAFLGLITLLVAGCAAEDLSTPAEPLGQFRLGHNVAIADETIEGPFSRDFTEIELEAAVQSAVDKRLRRYDGDGLYHLGIVVGAVILAQPGIPVLYAPASTMMVDVTVFDNTTQQKLNEEPKRIMVGEGIEKTVPLLGSGLVRSGEEQLANLSNNLAKAIEDWLIQNPEWFAPRPGQIRVPFAVGTPAPAVEVVDDEIVPAGEAIN